MVNLLQRGVVKGTGFSNLPPINVNFKANNLKSPQKPDGLMLFD